MKHVRNIRSETGQALVQVSIALIVLMGFVSLAIDVGHVYSERRRMQNAADAGALAGARQLCLGNTEADAIAEAQRYMIENGVALADIQAGDVTITEGYLVDTIARETADTFVAGVIGVTDVDVAASAAAACGAVTSGCGLWPIAFDLDLWLEINPEDSGVCDPKEFVVWNDEVKDITCFLPDPNDPTTLVEHENICDCYNCDPDGDGDYFEIITDLSRGWLDYSGAVTDIYTDECTASGCGAAELACQVRNDSGAKIELPTCIAGERGVRASIKDDVEARIGEVLGIPLFDTINCTVEFGNNCEGTDAETYHVTRIGCITVGSWEQNFNLDPIDPEDKINKKVSGKAIIVDVNCGGCYTNCGSTDGTKPEPWEMRAVSLTK